MSSKSVNPLIRMNLIGGFSYVIEKKLSLGFDMGKGEHKEQCISYTGLCAGKVGEIIVRELGLTNLDLKEQGES